MTNTKGSDPAFPADGGSAFPLYDYGNAGRGMSLRDYFAAHASDYDIAYHVFVRDEHGSRIYDEAGFYSKRSREAARYRFADAMLLAREQK